jgi:hypothetical protein
LTQHILHGLSSILILVEIQKGCVSHCFVEIAALDDWPAGCYSCRVEILIIVSYSANLCVTRNIRISISVLWNDSPDGCHTAPADAAPIRVLERLICVRIRTRRVVIQGSRSMHTPDIAYNRTPLGRKYFYHLHGAAFFIVTSWLADLCLRCPSVLASVSRH